MLLYALNVRLLYSWLYKLQTIEMLAHLFKTKHKILSLEYTQLRIIHIYTILGASNYDPMFWYSCSAREMTNPISFFKLPLDRSLILSCWKCMYSFGLCQHSLFIFSDVSCDQDSHDISLCVIFQLAWWSWTWMTHNIKFQTKFVEIVYYR